MNKPNVYFEDENGETYISSPEYDYTLDIVLGMIICMTFIPGIVFCLQLGGL